MAEDSTSTPTSRLQGVAERAHGLVDQARTGATASADSAAQAVHRRIDQAAGSATAAADWMSQRVSSYTRAPQAALETTCDTIRARPLLSVGVALAAGYLLGRMAR